LERTRARGGGEDAAGIARYGGGEVRVEVPPGALLHLLDGGLAAALGRGEVEDVRDVVDADHRIERALRDVRRLALAVPALTHLCERALSPVAEPHDPREPDARLALGARVSPDRDAVADHARHGTGRVHRWTARPDAAGDAPEREPRLRGVRERHGPAHG